MSKEKQTKKKSAERPSKQERLFRSLVEHEQHLNKKAKEKVEKKEYYLRKQAVMEREENNDDRIIVFKASQGNWWKMLGHSLIFYRHLVSKRIGGASVNVMPDTDYALRAVGGVVSIPDINGLERRMNKLGLKLDERNNDLYRAYLLEEKVTAELLDIWRNEERMSWEVTEKLIYPANLWVGLREAILALQREIVPAMSRIYEGSKLNYAKELVGQFPVALSRMTKAFYAAMGTPSNATEQLLTIMDALNDIRGVMMLMTGMQMMDVDRAGRIGDAIVKVHEQLNKELKAELRKEAKMQRKTEKKAEEKK